MENLLKKLPCTAFFTLYLCLFASFLCAESPGSISGVVHDASGARIASAHVTLRSASSAALLEALSDGQGEFRIEAAPGSYHLQIDLSGFKPLTTEALLTTAQPDAHLDLTLEIAAQSETV